MKTRDQVRKLHHVQLLLDAVCSLASRDNYTFSVKSRFKPAAIPTKSGIILNSVKQYMTIKIFPIPKKKK